MKFIPQGVSRTFARQILVAQKHSPRVMFVAGIGGVVVSTVLACRATLKVSDVLDDLEVEVAEHNRSHEQDPRSHDKRDLVYIYVKGTARVARLYAPALVVGGASIGALTGSHVTLTRRNVSLTAAYAAVQKSFDEYRERVRQELGPEKELDIHHAAVDEKVVGDDGKNLSIKSADPNKWSPYARFFEESNANWRKSSEYNRLFIQGVQNHCNHMLQARGHLFLNEVYDMLGLEHSSAGQVVGWVVGNGDNYVDFGLYEARSAAFINGFERNVILDFNVDGVIWDKI